MPQISVAKLFAALAAVWSLYAHSEGVRSLDCISLLFTLGNTSEHTTTSAIAPAHAAFKRFRAELSAKYGIDDGSLYFAPAGIREHGPSDSRRSATRVRQRINGLLETREDLPIPARTFAKVFQGSEEIAKFAAEWQAVRNLGRFLTETVYAYRGPEAIGISVPPDLTFGIVSMLSIFAHYPLNFFLYPVQLYVAHVLFGDLPVSYLKILKRRTTGSRLDPTLGPLASVDHQDRYFYASWNQRMMRGAVDRAVTEAFGFANRSVWIDQNYYEVFPPSMLAELSGRVPTSGPASDAMREQFPGDFRDYDVMTDVAFFVDPNDGVPKLAVSVRAYTERPPRFIEGQEKAVLPRGAFGWAK